MAFDPNIDTRYVRDRVDAADVLHRYAHHADHAEYDAFLGLFSNDARIRIGDGPVLTKAQFGAGLGQTPSEGQTRHVMTNLVVREQSARRIAGATYFVFYRTTAGKPRVEATGQYDFALVREEGEWRIGEWHAAIDA